MCTAVAGPRRSWQTKGFRRVLRLALWGVDVARGCTPRKGLHEVCEGGQAEGRVGRRSVPGKKLQRVKGFGVLDAKSNAHDRNLNSAVTQRR
jgi:hypothetical protein